MNGVGYRSTDGHESIGLIVGVFVVSFERCTTTQTHRTRRIGPLSTSVRVRRSENAVIAVVEIVDPTAAPDLARTLGEAGIGALEITVRTDGALEAIRAAAAEASLPVGAGTIMSAAVAEAAVDAGAEFLVSPVFDPTVSKRCHDLGVALLPGAVTPTEVAGVREAGFREVKIFPAEQCGGLALVKALAAVFPDMSFMPTGGVTHDGALDYLAHPHVAAVGGTWIAPRELIGARDWVEIGRRARAIVVALRDRET